MYVVMKLFVVVSSHWCDSDVYVWQELVDCLPKFAYPVNEDLVGYCLLFIF